MSNNLRLNHSRNWNILFHHTQQKMEFPPIYSVVELLEHGKMVAKSQQCFCAVVTMPSFLHGRLSRCSLWSKMLSVTVWIRWSGWMNRLVKKLKPRCVQKAEITEAFLPLKPLEKEWKRPALLHIPTFFYRHIVWNRCLIHTKNWRWFYKCQHAWVHTLMSAFGEVQFLSVHEYSELILLRYNSSLYT